MPRLDARSFPPRTGLILFTTTLVGLVLASACSPSTAGASSTAPAERLQALVDALDPPAPESTSDVKDAYYMRREATLRECRAAGPEFGRMALQLYEERPDAKAQVARGLLDVAAHNLGAELAPRLTEIFEDYELPLERRRLACELLPLTDPARTVELLEPLVLESRPRRTQPPKEAILASWSEASAAIDHDRSEVLVRVATDIYQDDRSRTLAVELLAGVEGPRAKQALETVLVESTGNGFLRMKAAQAIHDAWPAAEACATFERVMGLESDINFQRFLVDMIDRNCP